MRPLTSQFRKHSKIKKFVTLMCFLYTMSMSNNTQDSQLQRIFINSSYDMNCLPYVTRQRIDKTPQIGL